MSALKTVIKLLRAGESPIVFPEGARTLDGNLQPAQPGIGLIIAKTLVPVVPMRVFGAYEAMPPGKGPRLHERVMAAITAIAPPGPPGT